MKMSQQQTLKVSLYVQHGSYVLACTLQASSLLGRTAGLRESDVVPSKSQSSSTTGDMV